MLARDPDAPTRDLLLRARKVGYTGGKTAFYALVASVRQASGQSAGRPLAGERSHHDVGEVDLHLAAEGRKRLRFFVTRLPYSGWITASFVDGSAESVAVALLEHFEQMGGVPLVVRFERPFPVADAWSPAGKVLAWNTSFAYLAAELGIGLEVRRPRVLAAALKERFLRGHVFVDREDAASKLAMWCDGVNSGAPSDAEGAGGATPATLLVDERRRFRPLAVKPEELELREPIVVGAGGVVAHGTHVYSMPAAAAGRAGTILLGRDRVRVVAGPFEAVHPRLSERGASSLLPEHRT